MHSECDGLMSLVRDKSPALRRWRKVIWGVWNFLAHPPGRRRVVVGNPGWSALMQGLDPGLTSRVPLGRWSNSGATGSSWPHAMAAG